MKDCTATAAPVRNRKSPPPPPPPDAAAGVRCPRCDSSNTKFCYYNNYSLTQPRHFCKTCRRYWTKGGALRNVPIGGGCRKNKKPKPTSPDGFKFLEGLSPAVDFQISGIGAPPPPPFPRLLHHNTHQLGYHFPAARSVHAPVHNNNINDMNMASTIESLSFMNQDLHWKLQQQRLALLFGNGGEREQNNFNGGGDVAAGWCFGDSYVNHAAVGGGGSEMGQGATVGGWNNGVGGWNDHS